MGKSESKPADMLHFDESNWEFLKEERGRQIVKHRDLDLQGEVEIILLDPLRQLPNEMEIYAFRRSQEDALVAVYAVEALKANQATMCGNQQNVKVIHERIPRRFCELPQLTFPETVYALSEALRGFRECYSKVGVFEINDRMLGLNSKGHLRVWLNEYFAQNHPVTEQPLLQVTATAQHQWSASRQQGIMVKRVLAVIEQKCQEGHYPLDFKQKIESRNTFVQVYCEIEQYCEEKQLWIPDRIPLDMQRQKKSTAASQNPPHAAYVPNYEYAPPRNQQMFYVQSNFNPITEPPSRPAILNSYNRNNQAQIHSSEVRRFEDVPNGQSRQILSPRSQQRGSVYPPRNLPLDLEPLIRKI